ncbi:laccase-6-like isoform X1 [Musa acuminata AAA Group]|uniref:laccase-6-like isoform X1 n=1 Tax=Musa acuminata AAA Group TaxID=214697 RepID=UPI0031E26BC8
MAWSSCLLLWLSLLLSYYVPLSFARAYWPVGASTSFYHFKVQTLRVTKLCKTNDIVTVNGKFPGPVIYAQEDDRVIVRVTNQTPHNITIHWHGVRQRLSCWADGPSYITQCPIQAGRSYTYEFTLVQQKGTLLWHAHVSWLRATVHGAIVVYPKTGVPYPFPHPYEEHSLVFAEYWHKDVLQLEEDVMSSGGGAPPADAYLINGSPGPLYNCSATGKTPLSWRLTEDNNLIGFHLSADVYEIPVVPGKTYLLRLVSASLNTEHFFAIADHRMTIVEADGEYTKPLTVESLMIAPGQTINVLVQADQPIDTYDMALAPFMSAHNVPFQNTPAVAHFRYSGAGPAAPSRPAEFPAFNDSLTVDFALNNLRSLNDTGVPLVVDANLLFTIGLTVEQCHSSHPNASCQGPNGGVLAAVMNNIAFVEPMVSLLQAYYDNMNGYYTEDFPGVPLKNYDFVDGAPNDTQSLNGTRVKVLEFGSRVQLVLQNTGTVGTENHPVHLHGHSFHVVGHGTGNYNPMTAKLNLVDPPYMNTIGVPAGGWAAIRFVADNPGVWFVHCHLEVHASWGLAMAFVVKDGNGTMESLPHPPADLPRC